MRTKRLAILASLFPAAVFAAPMVGLTGTNSLVFFDSEAPAIVGGVAISGLAGGETLVGIDTRPATGELFALTSNGRIARIDLQTGAATLISPVGNALNGAAFGLDFNPTVDRIRVVSDTDQNLRFNPITGELAAMDTALSPSGDKVGVAYDRNFPGATLTTMFVIDSATDTLARQGGVDGAPSPNGGVIADIGPLGVNITAASDLDISQSGNARGAFGVGAGSGLYSINLTTGAATLIGNFPTGTVVTDLSFIPALPTRNAVTVPSLGTWAMVLMGLTLALAGAFVVRRRG